MATTPKSGAGTESGGAANAGAAAAAETPAAGARAGVYVVLALALGGGVFVWGLLRGQLLLYGDATAHLMIARRMLDSRTPGPSQWGGVWLPFPHWLMAPWAQVDVLWRTGAAGSVVSLAALAGAVFFLFRIAARHTDPRAAPWAALAFLANPNLLYLAAVPMTETVYLAAFLGAVDQIGAFAVARAAGGKSSDGASPRRARRHLRAAALWALAGALTRYDGWFCLPLFALAVWFAAAPASEPERGRIAGAPRDRERWRAAWSFSWIAALGPIFWFGYNAYYFKDWLAFLRGPYSARMIYLDALRHGGQRFPGDHQLWLAILYYLKCAALDCGAPLLLLALAGLLWWLWRGRQGSAAWRWPRGVAAMFTRDGSRRSRAKPGSLPAARARWRWPRPWILLLLLAPLPWYLWAMWSGNVPIFVPMYWPHGYYNLRYGVQLLPAAAVWAAWCAVALGDAARGALSGAGSGARSYRPGAARRIWEWAARRVEGGAAVVILISYLLMFGGLGPMAYAEALYNSPNRLRMEHSLARALAARRPGETILMFLGTYPGALADDGIALRDVIDEGNFRVWDGALAAPEKAASWVVIERGTIIDREINHAALREYFRPTASFTAPEQSVVTVWRRR